MPLVVADIACRRGYDLCVVGAGAAGLAVAFAVRAAGHSVLVIERGGSTAAPDPGEPEIAPGVPHDPAHRTNHQGLGGTLHAWGGRCVPFHSADFGPRITGMPGWPIPFMEYARWVPPAARFLGLEPVFERPVPARWPTLEGVQLGSVERLAPGRAFSDLRRRALRDESGPDFLLDCPVRGMVWAERRVAGLDVAVGGGIRSVAADSVVLACGGLQTTRLLLMEERLQPGRIAGSAALGRTYMGHLTGSIAEITFADAVDAAEFGYSRFDGGAPARRRFLLTPENSTHVALWVESLPGADPRHGSGELSIKQLARGVRGARRRHLANVCADPIGAATGVVSSARTRLYRQDRHPNRLIVRGTGPYRLAYHAEHLPLAESRVALAETKDALGLPRLRIDFAYGEATIRGAVVAHRALAAALDGAGLARLALPGDDAGLARAVAGQARDGYHQIGLTRMARTPEEGVVDADARVHGSDNLYIASASVFPVSSQANPTLSVVALALRLAARLVASRTAPQDAPRAAA